MNTAPTAGGGHALRGALYRDEPMSKHTAWGVGGTAERVYVPSDLQDLALFLRQLLPDHQVDETGFILERYERYIACAAGTLPRNDQADDIDLRIVGQFP